MSRNAVYLSKIGSDVRDVNALLAFEVIKARGLIGPLSELSGEVDLDVHQGLIGLQFMRTFPRSITQRYRLQSFRVGFIEQALRARAPIVPVYGTIHPSAMLNSVLPPGIPRSISQRRRNRTPGAERSRPMRPIVGQTRSPCHEVESLSSFGERNMRQTASRRRAVIEA